MKAAIGFINFLQQDATDGVNVIIFRFYRSGRRVMASLIS